MIDHVMRFNLPSATAKLAELAHVARVSGGEGGSDEARAHAFVEWLAELKRTLGIPAKLSAYQASRRVNGDDIARLVEVAVADTCHQTNPRPCTADDFRRIFAAAM
jgi:alcohol dehydrogenase class IV